ncbi:MAG: MoxR family ATPase, partial [Oscillospiraceae bacterium]|nr:MoxR family ATPase [Oscillospiraceae bacterium]
ISLDGKTFDLPSPFMVLATQNPVETYGTYHLPEAQMDRFLMKISMGYPTEAEELEIIERAESGQEQVANIDAVMTVDDVLEMINEAALVKAVPAIKKYIIDIVTATRNSEYVKLGVSPRGSIAMLKAAKAYAYVKGRNYVIPDDIKDIMIPVLAHRLILSPKGKSAFDSNEQALEQIALTVQAPTDGGTIA